MMSTATASHGTRPRGERSDARWEGNALCVEPRVAGALGCPFVPEPVPLGWGPPPEVGGVEVPGGGDRPAGGRLGVPDGGGLPGLAAPTWRRHGRDETS